MTLHAATQRITACLILFSLLFMQLAVASYVCPIPQAESPGLTQMTMQMPCHQADQNQPGLCHAHASDIGNKLSLDKPDMPDVQAFLPVMMAQTIDSFAIKLMTGHLQGRSALRLPAPAPPAMLLHCCFRI